MGKYVENEEVLIFKNKDYDCSVYPDCLVDKTFQTGKLYILMRLLANIGLVA